MPIVHDKNECGRAKHAGKIDQHRLCSSHLSFNDPSDPQKQRNIHNEVQPVEVQKRVRCNTPVFTMELAVIREAAKFEQCSLVSGVTGDEFNRKTDYQENNEDKRSLSFLHRAAPSREKSRAVRTRQCPRGKSASRRFPIRSRRRCFKR